MHRNKIPMHILDFQPDPTPSKRDPTRHRSVSCPPSHPLGYGLLWGVGRGVGRGVACNFDYTIQIVFSKNIVYTEEPRIIVLELVSAFRIQKKTEERIQKEEEQKKRRPEERRKKREERRPNEYKRRKDKVSSSNAKQLKQTKDRKAFKG